MRRYHVVIPTGHLGNAMESVLSVLRAHPTLVDDDVTLVTSLEQTALPSFLRRVRYVRQRTPFRITAAWNDAIAGTSPDQDIVLVNSDVRGPQRGAFDRLAACAEEHGGRAILTPAIEGHRWDDDRLRPDYATAWTAMEDAFFGFVCPYVPREVLATVGTFDERFVGYGCDDADYAVRARRAGHRLLVVQGAVVQHAPGCSEWRDLGRIDRVGQAESTRYFERKWGTHTHDVALWEHPEKYPPREVR